MHIDETKIITFFSEIDMVNYITCKNSIMMGLENCYITAVAVIIRKNLVMDYTFNIEEESSQEEDKRSRSYN